MADTQFPYTMYCPGCKVGIKIKKPELVGRRINCPKCDKKITVFTPDEDGNIPYGISGTHEKEPDPEPTEEELEEKEQQRLKELKAKRIKTAKEVANTSFLLLLLGGIAFVVYYFIILSKQEKAEDAKEPKRNVQWVRPQEWEPRLAQWPSVDHTSLPV